MGNACCHERSAAVRERQQQRQPPDQQPLRAPDWTEVVPLFREGVRGHPTVKERYVFKRFLGAGGFGAAWLAVRRPPTTTTGGGKSTSSPAPPRRVACKTIPWSGLRQPEAVEDLRRELSVMASLPRHPALARLHEVYEDETAVHLVTDLCDGGSLADRMAVWRREARCAEHRAARVALAVVEAVGALHAAGIMHRDLKPDNLMFSGYNGAEEEQLKIIDFGFAINFRPGDTFTDEVGSFPYMAPEVFERSYGPESDIWSAGVIVYQLLCGHHPFPAPDSYEAQRKATLLGAADVEGHPWPLITGGAKSLVLAMLEPDPTRRPTALQLLEHPWMKAAASASEAPTWRGLV